MKNKKHSSNRLENISKEIFTDMQDGRSVSEWESEKKKCISFLRKEKL